MPPVIADNCFNVILVNGRTALHEGGEIMVPIFQSMDDLNLVRQCHLRIRDNESGHEGMCFVTGAAADAADLQEDRTVKDFKRAEVISMYRKTGRVSTGACELEEVEAVDEAIIFILNIFSIGVVIKSG